MNNEIIFPIVQSIGLKGVVFFDAGNAFSNEQGFDFDDVRLVPGVGMRWLSPVGPLRVEVGKALNPKQFDEQSLLLFSFGGPFQY